jgi:methyl-accepting chemotaxis protein
MKKLFILFVTALFVIGVFILPCYAEEAVEHAEDIEEVDFLGRCEEWLDEHVGAIVGGSASATIVTLLLIFLKTNHNLDNIFSKVKKIKKTASETAETQDKQSKAINDLIDGLAEVGERINEIKAFGDFAERFKTLQMDLKAIAKVLDTVYSNSHALPQGTKNMVHTLCAEIMQIADSEIYSSEVKADERKT